MKICHKLIVITTLCISVKLLYADDILDEIRGTNSQMHRERTKNPIGNIELLAKKNSQVFSGITYGINFNKLASDQVRQAVRESIAHSSLNQMFCNKDYSYNLNIDERFIGRNEYLHHMAFLYINHEFWNLLRQPYNKYNVLTWTNDKITKHLQRHIVKSSCSLNCFRMTNELKLENFDNFEKQFQIVIKSYTKEHIIRILGNDPLDHYLDYTKDYRDVKDSWLSIVRGINDGKTHYGSKVKRKVNDTNIIKYINDRGKKIAYMFSNYDTNKYTFLFKLKDKSTVEQKFHYNNNEDVINYNESHYVSSDFYHKQHLKYRIELHTDPLADDDSIVYDPLTMYELKSLKKEKKISYKYYNRLLDYAYSYGNPILYRQTQQEVADDSYTIVLSWINASPPSKAHDNLICSEELFKEKLENPIRDWQSKQPQAMISVCYDSQMLANPHQDLSNTIKKLEENGFDVQKIKFIDIRSTLLQTNFLKEIGLSDKEIGIVVDSYTSDEFIFNRVGFTKHLIGMYLLKTYDYVVKVDSDVVAINKNHTFDQRTMDLLQKFGCVMTTDYPENMEDSFIIFSKEKKDFYIQNMIKKVINKLDLKHEEMKLLYNEIQHLKNLIDDCDKNIDKAYDNIEEIKKDQRKSMDAANLESDNNTIQSNYDTLLEECQASLMAYQLSINNLNTDIVMKQEELIGYVFYESLNYFSLFKKGNDDKPITSTNDDRIPKKPMIFPPSHFGTLSGYSLKKIAALKKALEQL